MNESSAKSYVSQNTAQTVALEDTFSIERYRQFASLIKNPSGKILDVGCAEGRGGSELKMRLPDTSLIGLDCVEDRVRNLPASYSGSIVGFTTAIPAEDQTFDAIVAGEFIEHLYPMDVDATLCEFQRILKVGGQLLMTTPNPYSLKMRKRGGTVYGVAHLSQHFPECLRERMKMHGFSRIRILGSGKASLLCGMRFPILSVYGSYMIIGSKY